MGNRTQWVIAALVAAALVAGVAHAGGGFHGQHAQMLKQADANGDGQTTVAEAKAKVLQRAVEIDANRDGAISLEELQAHREQMRAQRRAARFAALDADKNGQVSVEEFAAVRAERIERFDRNGDGILDASDHRGFRRGEGHQHH